VVDTLLEPGIQRTEPVCAVFGSCGGCAWQHVRYDAQLAAKRAIATAALERIGGLALPHPLKITASPSPYGYRSRSRVLVDGGKVGYRRRRSNTLCPTRRCPVLVSELDQRLSELADDPPRVEGEWELASGTAISVRASGSPLAETASASRPASLSSRMPGSSTSWRVP
jgi:23S rRNA (uracil1939-C5)-methyltransferase